MPQFKPCRSFKRNSVSEPKKQHHAFEAEVDQLLHLVAHSLYSHKEIFLRELISNAADALDRLRFEALSDDSLYEGDSDLGIRIEVDEQTRTLTISDNGIGMSRSEVTSNIGTIARSGTRAFLKSLGEEKQGEVSQIGQFGVGFYSAFIVADRVTLVTRRAGGKQGACWESDGRGGYDLSRVNSASRGTSVTLHLKEDESEFLEDYRLREIIKRYSDHTPFPISLQSRDDKGQPTDDRDTVNQAKALWARPKKELNDGDYQEFYPHVAHDPNPPLAWTHHRVEGRNEYSLLLYLPSKAPFDLADPNPQHGVKLYVQRVFILDEPDKLMPRYLRFVRGIVDSNDLPLNISRELLQNNRTLDTIRSACVRRVLDLLENLSTSQEETYEKFWTEFGHVLKEGTIEDIGNQAQILKLLRFHSTQDDEDALKVTLDDYIERMQDGQEKIYYLTIDSLAAARRSPHLEVFRQRGIEVLLMTDPVDEWVMDWVREYEGKSFQSVAKGELDLPGADAEEKPEEETDEDPLCAQIQEALGDEVEAVRRSSRLTDSPSCLVRGEHDFSPAMWELMRRQGQPLPKPKLILEINPDHTLLQRMQADEGRFSEWARWLLDQAVLADGGPLEDPGSFVSRMNELLASPPEPDEAGT
ncbi:MAG: molecular chaperone HtpG [Gammaproteobacteria bacterium]|nr:molecular chaperone HtpG [Gammaproteobacteria bacterium]